MPLNRYPAILPADEAKTVLAYFRGQGNAQDALEAGWWLQGYAMSMLPAVIGPQQITFGAGVESQADVEAALESLANAPATETQTAQAGGALLLTLAQALLPLLLKLIQQKATP